MDEKLLYRIPEVTAALNVSRSKVYELVKADEITTVHIHRTCLVRSDELHAYVDSLSHLLRWTFALL